MDLKWRNLINLRDFNYFSATFANPFCRTMKRLFALTFWLCLFCPAFAQEYQVGLLVNPNATSILNANVASDGEQQDYTLSTATIFGAYGGVYFAKNLGVELNLLYGKHSQEFEGVFGGQEYTSAIDLNTFNIPVLAKIGDKVYFEIGPQFSFITKAEYACTSVFSIANGDRTEDFQTFNTSLTFGFGGNVNITDQIFLTGGFRASFGFSDIEGLDARGQKLKDDDLYTGFGYYAEDDYAKSRTLAAGLKFGVVYRIHPN